MLDDDGDIQSNQRTYICRQCTVAGHNQNRFVVTRDAHSHFFDLVVLRSRGLINLAQQLHLIFIGQTADGIGRRIQRRKVDRFKTRRSSLTTTAYNRSSCLGCLLQTIETNVFTVGKPSSLPSQCTQPDTRFDTKGPLLHDAVFQRK